MIESVLPGVHNEFQVLRQMIEQNCIEGNVMKDSVVSEIQMTKRFFQIAL